jgi:peptide/nickel transport system substrate-binding protein
VKRLLVVLALLTAASTATAADRTFVYHLNGPPDALDPAKCSNQRCARVMWALYEPLVNLGPDAKSIVPGLAESWEASPDGLRYTFRLRRGVTFHDGTRFNAAAAQANIERNYLRGSRFYTEDPPNVRERAIGGLVKEVIAVDEHTVTVVLKNRQVHLLFQVPMVSPEALARQGGRVGDHPVGTGPFRFTRRNDQEIILTANDAYWGGRPKIDRLTFRIVRESERTLQEFLAGRLDFLPEVEPLYLERIVANPTTELIRVPTLSVYYVGLRTDRKPFQDIRVRQAISKAVDVERAVLFIGRGTAVPAYGPIPPGAESYDPAVKRNQYDPAAARRLLQEAGYGGGLHVSLLFNAGWGFFGELAQTIKADLQKVGVAVELVPQPGYRELVAEVRQGRADMFMYNWFSILGLSEIFLGSLFSAASPENLTRYGNPRVDALLTQARDAMNEGAREDLFRRAQRLIIDDAPMVFLFHEVRVSAFNKRVTGLELNSQSYPVDRFVRLDVRSR